MSSIDIHMVSEHAVLRYIERNKRVICEIEENIVQQIREGVDVRPRNPISKKSQPVGKPARYVKCGKLVFVISHEGVVITTLKYDYQQFVKVKSE